VLNLGEKRYYGIVREWLESQGYYCGGNIAVRNKPNYYQDIGSRSRRADVAGIKNVGSRYQDQIEIVAVEVRDTATVSDQDFRDTDNYHQYAHKCYLATTAPITTKHRQIAERRNIGLLSLERGKKRPKAVHDPNPEQPRNHAEMMDFLNSFQIVKCSICGCFFERFVIRNDKYHSYLSLTRPRYFKVMNETKKIPFEKKDLESFTADFNIKVYICELCIRELFLKPIKVKKMRAYPS
jgi:hypothetical protein